MPCPMPPPTQQVVQALPQMKVAASSKLLEPGWQCRLCLNAFCVGQHVRRLPCNHKFHTSCIDQWLTSTSSSCPWTVRRSAHSRRGHSQTIERRHWCHRIASSECLHCEAGALLCILGHLRRT
uniref:Zinc finger, SWIM-type containing 2 n=1 Tax=Erpetoichthys calabaricus TaxID=27687 RepID=A0A8C4TNU9_ERPCA